MIRFPSFQSLIRRFIAFSYGQQVMKTQVSGHQFCKVKKNLSLTVYHAIRMGETRVNEKKKKNIINGKFFNRI